MVWKRDLLLAAAPLIALLAVPALGADGEEQAALPPAEQAFTEDFLSDPQVIALGQDVWQSRCRFCHGRATYGKAPRLRPSRYNPQFIYNRVTHGFRGMPSFKEEFSEEQRRAVAAYVLSDRFAP